MSTNILEAFEDEDDEETDYGILQVISEEQRGFTATLTLQPQNGHSITLRAFVLKKPLKYVARLHLRRPANL